MTSDVRVTDVMTEARGDVIGCLDDRAIRGSCPMMALVATPEVLVLWHYEY